MRYVLAIGALVLSGVLLLLGIGQRTFLAGPAEIRYEIDVTTEAEYAVIDAAELSMVSGQANVVVDGENVFVATGSTRDVLAWVEPFSSVQFGADKKAKSLVEIEPESTVEAEAEAEAEVETETETEANADETGTKTADAEGSGADASGAEGSTVVADAETDSELTDGQSGEEEALVNPVDPRGSDLWLAEKSRSETDEEAVSSELRVALSLSPSQSVLVASDGEQALPEQISLVWVQARETPWAGPLLAAGGVLALVGAVLYILAVDHDRRGLGPRRGRKGPLQGIRNSLGRRNRDERSPASTDDRQTPGGAASVAHSRSVRRAALPALGLAIALGLSGCSASYWPQFGAEEAVVEETPIPQNTAPVPVTEAQLDQILDRIVEVAGTADDELSVDTLAARFTGDALAQRTANYKIRSSLADYGVVPPRLTTDELDYQLVQSTESWPRTLLVTIASERAGADEPAEGEAVADSETVISSPSLAVLMTQDSPYDNYMVSHVISLRGGIKMPAAAPAEEGTALLADDLESLLIQPGQVGTAFASLLQEGEASEYFDLFDLGDDPMLENYGKARAEQSAAQAESNGTPMTYSASATQGEEPTVALSTGIGGALIATTVIEEQTVDSGGSRYKAEPSAVVTALSDLSGQQDRIVQQIAHQMLFFVPSKDDEGAKIQLLGETSELVGVRN